MEWVLAAVVLWLLRARRRDRRTAAASRGGPTRPVRSPDGREVLNVEGSLFAPASPDEPGWAWVGVEGTTAAQVQHTTTIGAVIAGPGNAGGGRPGTADGVQGRILRGPDGVLGTEVLLPDAFEPTPPGRVGGRG